MPSIREWFNNHDIRIEDHGIFFVGPPDEYGLREWKDTPRNVYLSPPNPQFYAAIHQRFDDGFGTAKVPMFFVWAEDHVFFREEYDGSTHLMSVPASREAAEKEFST